MHEKLAAALRDARVPAASLAVWADGVTHTAAAGILNVATGTEATPESVFQVGSITKVLTATLVLQFRDRGWLDLDDTVSHFLPHVADTPLGGIRVRSLLTHQGGLLSDGFVDTGDGDDCISRYVELLAREPVLFEPDTCASYSNPGFVLLGAICERVGGRSWDDLVAEHVLGPAGMHSSFTRPIELARHRAAIGHYTDPATGTHSVVPVVALPRSSGPGGSTLWSTAGDILKFARALALDTATLLAADSVDEMLTAQVDFPGGGGSFGYAWALTRRGGQTWASHGGATVGQNSTLLIVPEQSFAICLLTNSGAGVTRLARLFQDTIERFLGPQPAPMPPRRDSLSGTVLDPDRYVGEYRSGDVWIHVAKSGDQLVVSYENMTRPDTPERSGRGVLVAIAPDEFISAPSVSSLDAGVPVRFLTVKPGAGRPDVLYSMARAYRRVNANAVARSPASS